MLLDLKMKNEEWPALNSEITKLNLSPMTEFHNWALISRMRGNFLVIHYLLIAVPNHLLANNTFASQ